MKITNVRRGRIIRMVATLAVLIMILFSLHKWSSDNIIVKAKESVGPYKIERSFHPNIYPVMSNDLGNFEPRDLVVPKGNGEGGVAFHPPSSRENDVSESISNYGMNIVVSDYIALNRSIPDTRLDECAKWKYPTDLPSTSVIIVFHNEGLSVLLRTVHSVINRSPPNILKEVVLVDDFSDKENLKDELEDKIKIWKGKVKLFRNTEREGLIRTRSRGANEANGKVIVFLDAHCEVNINWLPPLLAPIYRDSSIMTVPVIDGIDHNTFEYRQVYQAGTHFRGIFEWGMLYKENDVPEREIAKHKYKSEPYKSPTHAGGLFAIDREYFLSIGAYDPGLLVWGGENFELSFKIWQCGGSIEWVPCSRVGHVYRAFMPYSFGSLARKKKGSLITINYKRVIETWFDEEHKEYFYTREPMARFLDHGDITEQIALKKNLGCKDFKWFMENVAYDVYDKFPKLPKNVHWGTVRNVATSLCLDTMGRAAPSHIGTNGCHGSGGNQIFRLNAAGQLGNGERCVEATKDSIMLTFCRIGTVDGPWAYDISSKHLIHRLNNDCLTIDPPNKKLKLAECSDRNTHQKWTINEPRS